MRGGEGKEGRVGYEVREGVVWCDKWDRLSVTIISEKIKGNLSHNWVLRVCKVCEGVKYHERR